MVSGRLPLRRQATVRLPCREWSTTGTWLASTIRRPGCEPSPELPATDNGDRGRQSRDVCIDHRVVCSSRPSIWEARSLAGIPWLERVTRFDRRETSDSGSLKTATKKDYLGSRFPEGCDASTTCSIFKLAIPQHIVVWALQHKVLRQSLPIQLPGGRATAATGTT